MILYYALKPLYQANDTSIILAEREHFSLSEFRNYVISMKTLVMIITILLLLSKSEKSFIESVSSFSEIVSSQNES